MAGFLILKTNPNSFLTPLPILDKDTFGVLADVDFDSVTPEVMEPFATPEAVVFRMLTIAWLYNLFELVLPGENSLEPRFKIPLPVVLPIVVLPENALANPVKALDRPLIIPSPTFITASTLSGSR